MHACSRFALCSTVLALASPIVAQTVNPYSLHTVAVSANGTTPAQGELYRVDHQTNTATKITIPAIFNTDRPNTIYMTSPATGFFATNHITASASGSVYGFTLAGTTFILGNSNKPLNTSAFAGNNLSQIAVVGAKLYTISQTWNTTANRGEAGKLQSIPVTGGAVTVEYDTASVVGNTNTHLANALCAVGTKLYIGMWYLTSNTTTGGGEIFEYDTVTKKGAKLMDLPKGLYKGAAGTLNYSFGVVNMHATSAGNLACVGVYGDVAVLDPVKKTVVSHTHSGNRNAAGHLLVNTTNSGFYDATTNDWVIGSRRRTIERWADGHAAKEVVLNIGSHPTVTSNSVNGSWHFPDAKNSDKSYGAGCHAKTGGYTPTDVGKGAALAGNANYEIQLFSGTGGQNFILTLGLDNKKAFGGAVTLPWDMGAVGAGGCFLRVDPLLYIGGKLAGTGAGMGTASIKVPLPSTLPKGTFVHRQWAVNDPGAVLVVSNARTITIQ